MTGLLEIYETECAEDAYPEALARLVEAEPDAGVAFHKLVRVACGMALAAERSGYGNTFATILQALARNLAARNEPKGGRA